MYDYLIVGSGLFGAVFAHEMKQAGKSCLVLERRPHVGGNVYCEEKEGIHIHTYGAHIFHTSDKKVWNYVNQFVEFNNYVNSPVANYKGELYNLPFNMNTFAKMWGIVTPAEAAAKIAAQRELPALQSRKTWKNRPFPSLGRTFIRSSSRATRKNSGAAAVQTCRLLSSSGCPCAIPSTTTTLTTAIRAFLWAATTFSSRAF